MQHRQITFSELLSFTREIKLNAVSKSTQLVVAVSLFNFLLRPIGSIRKNAVVGVPIPGTIWLTRMSRSRPPRDNGMVEMIRAQ
jgi:hypothetical protein